MTVPTVRLLIVDDDTVDRRVVQRALRGFEQPVECDEVPGLEAALNATMAGRYHCIFLDYLLPDGDGLEVVRGLRSRGVRTPIIILTGQGGERLAVELMKAGANDYLLKGEATAERIQASLRAALRLREVEALADEAQRERERALELERSARQEAEAARGRLAFLAEASTLLASSLDPAATLHNVARVATPGLADACLVHLLEEGGAIRELVAAPRPSAPGVEPAFTETRYGSLVQAPALIAAAITRGTTEASKGADDLPASIPWARATVRRCVSVPLSVHGRILGAFTFVNGPSEREILEGDLPFLGEVANRAALAIENARLYRDTLEARERLHHQLDFTRAITNSLVEGLVALDLAGNVTFANAAAERMLGLTAGELLGHRLHDLIHPPSAREGRGVCAGAGACPFHRGFATDQAVHMGEDHFVRQGSNAAFPVGYAAGPIVASGLVVGSVIAMNDLTLRKAEEAELDASRRQVARTEKLSALGTLVSGVAHEIRTPLTYVNNNLYLMLRKAEAAAKDRPELAGLVNELRACGAAALEGVDRIRNLVKDLRPFANTEPTKAVEATLHEVAAEAAEFFQATQRGRVEVDLDLRETAVLRLDTQQVQRVILNLLINGAEAMPRGGTLRLATRAAEGGAEVSVTDTGVGIPGDVQARMFDPFFTTKQEGTGLGLAITRRIVEAHGGAIRYQTGEGRGTTFTIFLPLKGPPGGESVPISRRDTGVAVPTRPVG